METYILLMFLRLGDAPAFVQLEFDSRYACEMKAHEILYKTQANGNQLGKDLYFNWICLAQQKKPN